MECYIFVYRIYSFSVSEEYASVHCRNYASRQISESYAERILFFLFFFFFFGNLYNLVHPTPILPYWSVLHPRFVYFGKYLFILNMAFLKDKLLNGQ